MKFSIREDNLLEMYDRTTLETALQALGDLLADRGQPYVVVAIGGGALSLLGLIDRSTEDVDLVGLIVDEGLTSAQPLPAPLAEAIVDIATLHHLQKKWMNGGPTSLVRLGLPHGFLDRCTRRQFGGLTVLFADRFDQIHLKLFAMSRPFDKHHHDLQRLTPTRDELLAAAAWARTQAVGEGFEMELRAALNAFGVPIDDA
ncbi:MAG: DUF6036 family nucleotidyltransferase [Kofleriaceae bacterium]